MKTKNSDILLEVYKKAFDNSPNAKFLVAYDKKGTQFIHVNKGFTKIYGYEESEVIGKNPKILKSGRQEQAYYKVMWSTLLDPKKGYWQDTIINRTKGGGYVDVILTISTIFDDSGRPTYFVGQHIDVTREAEIDRAKSDFISTASHQLRTPITGIKWALEKVLEKKIGLQEWQTDFLSQALNSVRQMTLMVNDLLNISRLEMGGLHLDLEVINLNDLISKSIEKNHFLADKRGQKLKFSPLKPNVRVTWDARLFLLALDNIVSNGLRYSKEGGVVKIKVIKENKMIKIHVIDNGFGISKESQKNIFIKFFRSDEAKAIDPNGSGLGLYIFDRIIKVCGGSHVFKSQLGKGSTFTMVLPVKLKSPKKPIKMTQKFNF